MSVEVRILDPSEDLPRFQDDSGAKSWLIASLNISSDRIQSINESYRTSAQEAFLSFDVFPAGESMEPGAREAVQRAAQAWQARAASNTPSTGSATSGSSVTVKIIDAVVGKACHERPRVKHAQTDMGSCVPSINGRECIFQCLKDYVSTGRLLCVDGVWTPAQCEEKACEEVPVVQHAGDLSHCLGAALPATL